MRTFFIILNGFLIAIPIGMMLTVLWQEWQHKKTMREIDEFGKKHDIEGLVKFWFEKRGKK